MMSCTRDHVLSTLLVLGAILTSGAKADLIGHWKFDEGSGATIEDSSGNGHHGDVKGIPEWGPGVDGFGEALNFTGTVGAEIPSFDPTGGTGTFTLTFWSNWDGAAGIQHFLTKSNGWGADTMMFQVECIELRIRQCV